MCSILLKLVYMMDLMDIRTREKPTNIITVCQIILKPVKVQNYGYQKKAR